jgi:hypothetical protein
MYGKLWKTDKMNTECVHVSPRDRLSNRRACIAVACTLLVVVVALVMLTYHVRGSHNTVVEQRYVRLRGSDAVDFASPFPGYVDDLLDSIAFTGHRRLFGTIQHVILTDTTATDDDVGLLRGQSTIEQLYLGSTQITDDALRTLATLTGVTTLFLEGTDISSDGVLLLGNLDKIGVLQVSHTRIDDRCLPLVGRLDTLTLLNVGYTSITDDGIAYLEGLSQLESLNLRNTECGDSSMAVIAGLPSLKWLDIRCTRVKDGGIGLLRKSKIETLLLDGCRASPGVWGILSEMKELRLLFVDDEQVDESVEKRIGRFPNLSRLVITCKSAEKNRVLQIAEKIRAVRDTLSVTIKMEDGHQD